MKKKPLCIKELAHGKCDENDQSNWISAVATLINTDVIASGKSYSFLKYFKRRIQALAKKTVRYLI